MGKKNKMKKSAVVGVIVDNEILMLKRQYRENKSNGWCLPGGKLEPNETSIDGAIRETFEETGITIDAPEYLGEEVSNNGEFMVDIYMIKMTEKNPVTLSIREHSEYQWVPLNEVESFLTLAGNTPNFVKLIKSKI